MKSLIIYSIAGCVLCGISTVSAQTTHRTLAPRSVYAISQKTERTDSIVDAYVRLDPSVADLSEISNLGIELKPLTDQYATARIPLSLLGTLAEMDGVEYVETATKASKMLDIARGATGIDKVNTGNESTKPYKGKGVVVGIVDAGFDYGHAAFKDADGNLRIKRVWEQSTTATSSQAAPEKFGYGLELSDPVEILNAAGDVLNNSHGTHVAALAAGSDNHYGDTYMGMAPEADIVLVSMGASTDNNVNISNAISYIYDYAGDRPCVVNLSLGTHSGPHDGTSIFDVIADELQGPGRLIVGSAGNHRADKFHVTHRFENTEESPLRTFVDFGGSSLTLVAGGTIEFWGEAGGEFEVAMIAYNTSRGEVAERVVVYPQAEAGAQEVSLGRNITGSFTAASEISPLNGKSHVVLTNNIRSIRSGYAVAIEVTPKSKGQVDIWADDVNLKLTSLDKEGFTAPGQSPTIAEIGGTAKRILSVGAYTTRSEYVRFNETTVNKLEETNGDISSFSSAGPTADGRMKPQVSAPGCFIASAVSNNDGSGTLIIATSHSDGSREHMYGFMQGTSMSSPIVAGIVATWLEACPTLTPEQLVEVIEHTSIQDEYTGKEPNSDWGYGKIDAYAGLKKCIAMFAGVSSPVADKNVVVSYDANIGVSATFLSAATDVSVEVYSTDGRMVGQKAASRIGAGDTLTVPLAAHTKGVYVVRISQNGSTVYTRKVM